MFYNRFKNGAAPILTQPRLYWFPIGTISKVKKIVRFCDDKIIKARSAHQIYLYVLQHIFGCEDLVLLYACYVKCKITNR